MYFNFVYYIFHSPWLGVSDLDLLPEERAPRRVGRAEGAGVVRLGVHVQAARGPNLNI